jgi:hypothetical protein
MSSWTPASDCDEIKKVSQASELQEMTTTRGIGTLPNCGDGNATGKKSRGGVERKAKKKFEKREGSREEEKRVRSDTYGCTLVPWRRLARLADIDVAGACLQWSGRQPQKNAPGTRFETTHRVDRCSGCKSNPSKKHASSDHETDHFVGVRRRRERSN